MNMTKIKMISSLN